MKILFNNSEGLQVIDPGPNVDPKIIADKTVPKGVPYLIVGDSDLPSRETRPAWECEITTENKHGVGLSKAQFHKKYPELSHWGVIE